MADNRKYSKLNWTCRFSLYVKEITGYRTGQIDKLL